MIIPQQCTIRKPLIDERSKLEKLHAQLFGKPRCEDGGCFICSARRGQDAFLDRHTATSEKKWKITERIKKYPARLATGAIAGQELAAIFDNFSLEELNEGRVRKILTESELPALDGSDVTQDTQNYDQFLELYLGAFLRSVGCANIRFEETGTAKNVDLAFEIGEHRFAIECKRLKSKNALRHRPDHAKMQLEDYRARDSGANLLMLLDCSYYIMESLGNKMFSPFAAQEALVRIWRSFEYAYFCLQARRPDRYLPVRHNAYYGTIVTARVPVTYSDFSPNVLFQMVTIVDCEGKSEEAISILTKQIMRTMSADSTKNTR